VTKHSGSVVILGAGPAGLTTGYTLSRAGWDVAVFELMPQVGGLARTVVENDYRFDIGGHRWFTKQDVLNRFLIEVVGDELIMVDRVSRIYFDGKYIAYPLRATDVLAKISPLTGARALTDLVASQASQQFRQKPVVSMEDAYVAQFGRTVYELLFKQYSEKVWGRDCTELSGDWVTQRSKGLSLLTALRSAVKKPDKKVESLVDQFMYPRLGFGRISERMAEAIESGGGQVRLGWHVERVEHDGQSIKAIVVSDGRRTERVGGDAFVSSIPMTELVQILSPRADRAVLEATERLTYRGLITVNLMLDRPRVTNDTWVYVQDPAVSFARLHEPRNWSPDMAPVGKTSLVLEFFCEPGDPLWERSDDDLCALAARDLAEKLRFIELHEVLGGFALRSRDAYPRYGLDYRPAVDAIKQYLRSFGNLSIVGRGGTFRYNNTDHAVETGLLAARSILGEAVDLDSVNSQNEYLEERRVRPLQAGA
jgi:protoporphyrinogen oxidase